MGRRSISLFFRQRLSSSFEHQLIRKFNNYSKNYYRAAEHAPAFSSIATHSNTRGGKIRDYNGIASALLTALSLSAFAVFNSNDNVYKQAAQCEHYASCDAQQNHAHRGKNGNQEDFALPKIDKKIKDYDEAPDTFHLFEISPNYSAVAKLKEKLHSAVCGVAQYAANKPIEDRLHVERLKNGGWWFSVFDGHGGWQCSDYAHKILHQNFEFELNNHLGYFPKKQASSSSSFFTSLTKPSQSSEAVIAENEEMKAIFRGNISSKVIVQALKAAYERTDRQYMGKVVGAFELGFGRDTRAGSCAISVFVLDGVLFCANAGDCRAVIASSKMPTSLHSQALDEAERQAVYRLAFTPGTSVSEKKAESIPLNYTTERKFSVVECKNLFGNRLIVEEDLQQAALNNAFGIEPDPVREAKLREILLQKVLEVNDRARDVKRFHEMFNEGFDPKRFEGLALPEEHDETVLQECEDYDQVVSAGAQADPVVTTSAAPSLLNRMYSFLRGNRYSSPRAQSVQNSPIGNVAFSDSGFYGFGSRKSFVVNASFFADEVNKNINNFKDNIHANPDMPIDFRDSIEVMRLSTDHNAKFKLEQDKLKAEHPNEPDIVLCKSKTSCYVKGRLQPTRSLGDFHLKFSEFRLPHRNNDQPAAYENSPYTPPYITCTPEVKTRRLNSQVSKDAPNIHLKDEFLIMASDGLWDMMDDNEAGELVIKWVRICGKTPTEAAEMLIDAALKKSADKNKMSLEELKTLPAGRSRRSKHDDISVIVIDINQLLDVCSIE